MDPLTIAAGVSAVTGLGSQIFNAHQTGKMNKRAEDFAWRMHAQQRQDHWQDLNYANWYNAPLQQMERLKEGGLNPHLIYGTGSNAAGTSSAGRAANVSSPRFQAPKMDIGSVVMQGMQLKQLQSNIARTDAETAAITSRTLEQDWKNTFLTPEMFKIEYDARKKNIESDVLSRTYGAETANINADIRNLELENMNLISGRNVDSNRKYRIESDRANMVLDKMQMEINNIMQRSRNLDAVTTNLELDAVTKKWEADLIQNFNLNATTAQQLLSNIFKLILLKR